MGIRIKILAGFLVLAVMLAIAGGWTIYELRTVGTSVQNILDENYSSIHAAKGMKEALEREDSAVLLLMLGKWDEGRAILHTADSTFNSKLRFISSNATVPGEAEHLQDIHRHYAVYKKLWERPIVDTNREGNITWYFGDVHTAFLKTKASLNNLINLNNEQMYETASMLENSSSRAILPGIVAILAALLFTAIFMYMTNYYIVNPIILITNRINKFKERRTPFDVHIETHDEIASLAEAIEHLCASVSDEGA